MNEVSLTKPLCYSHHQEMRIVGIETSIDHKKIHYACKVKGCPVTKIEEIPITHKEAEAWQKEVL